MGRTERRDKPACDYGYHAVPYNIPTVGRLPSARRTLLAECPAAV